MKIVVPSFSSSTALFAQHFSIIRELKKRVEALRNSCVEQRDEENSWIALEKVLGLLDAALRFLNFPIQV